MTTFSFMFRVSFRHLAVGVCLLGSFALTGCKSFDMKKPIPWAQDEDEVRAPDRFSAMWSDAVENRPGLASRRGFGGRVMFYTGTSDKPVKVAGQLTVYAFDEAEHKKSENCVPEKRFVFTAEQVESHYSKSLLGHSYSFWLPWDEVGGERRKISLVAKFEPLSGGAILTELTTHVLPGKEPEKNHPLPVAAPGGQPLRDSAVSQASYQETVSAATNLAGTAGLEGGSSKPAMTTTTIDLPPSFSAQYTRGVHHAEENAALPMTSGEMGAAPPASQGDVQPAGEANLPQRPRKLTAEQIEQERIKTAHDAWNSYQTQGWQAYQEHRQNQRSVAGFQPGRPRVQGGPVPRLSAAGQRN